jgi:hypothetical protein
MAEWSMRDKTKLRDWLDLVVERAAALNEIREGKCNRNPS